MAGKLLTAASIVFLFLPRATHSAADDRQRPKADAGWSKVISRKTIEDEIKRLTLQVEKDVTAPGDFARGGYKKARRHFTELAALFGIIEQNNVMTRWMREAPELKLRFARAALVCKVGSRPAFNLAVARKADLQKLVAGGKLKLADNLPKRMWGETVDRSPLMQRMEELLVRELKPGVADKKAFAANRMKIQHNAELIAAVSTILRQQTMEEADDDDYAGHAKNLTNDAIALSRAAKKNDHNAAKAALTALTQNCTNCHADFR